MVFPILGGNSAVAGYSIDNSLRFNDGDSAYLSRTNSSGGSRKIFTFSCWFKKSTLGSASDDQILFSSWDGSNGILIQVDSNDLLQVYSKVGGTVKLNVRSEMVFRDVSAYYHLVVKFDSNSTNLDLYVNGVEISQTVVVAFTDADHEINESGGTHYICSIDGSSRFWDGYLAETHFIDGTAKSPTDFGEFDEDSGIWKPKQYSGSYGTNGFYLDFENSGSLGADQSGNGNNFTPTNLASTDQTTDTPTNNFATLNPLNADHSGAWSFSEGNSKFQATTTDWVGTSSTQGVNTGKWYAEFKMTTLTTSAHIGIGASSWFSSGAVTGDPTVTSGNRYSRYLTGVSDANEGKIADTSGGLVTYGSNTGASTGDIISVAMDLDNNKVYWATNGTWENSANPATNTNGFSINADTYQFGVWGYQSTSEANFGNPSFSISSGNSDDNGYGNFEYAPPSGYLALCTQNLATELSPTIDDGSEYFNTVLYTGNGGTNAVTGVGFKPDWIWVKERSSTSGHRLADTTRGATKSLTSNDTGSETTNANIFSSLDSDGFTHGADNGVNESGQTYASWNWKANAGSTSSNTDGSITSTVQANTTAGFNIITYTGDGNAGATFGHGLGVVPDLIIVKRRGVSGSRWNVWTPSLTNNQALYLDGNGATQSSTTFWNDTTPTSSVITLGTDRNVNGGTYVCYAFKNIEGYSSLGKTYTGNGNADGTFVYTGFRPAFVIIKRTDSTNHWLLFDVKRDAFNVGDKWLRADTTDAEATGIYWDGLSNGLKPRTSDPIINASGGTYIYLAFAENPFVSSKGVPVTAR